MDQIPLPTGIAYLATPYSRYPGGPDMAFYRTATLAARLIRLGIHVYSPIAHTHPIAVYGDIDLFDHTIWLPFDEEMMKVSKLLLVAHMDGWEESFGISEEIKFFEAAHKPIFDLDPVSLVMVRRREMKPVRERIDGSVFEEVEKARKEWLGVQT